MQLEFKKKNQYTTVCVYFFYIKTNFKSFVYVFMKRDLDEGKSNNKYFKFIKSQHIYKNINNKLYKIKIIKYIKIRV